MKFNFNAVLIFVCTSIIFVSALWFRLQPIADASHHNFHIPPLSNMDFALSFSSYMLVYTFLILALRKIEWKWFFLAFIMGIIVRCLFLTWLPRLSSDLWRHEVYGELFWTGYDPYTTTGNDIVMLVEQGKIDVPTMLEHSIYPYQYPTASLYFFASLCFIFPGYGSGQLLFLKIVLTLVDVSCVILIWRICNSIGKDPRIASILFLLNPISIYKIASEGQTESLPLLFMLLCIYLLLKNKHQNRKRFSFGSAISLSLATLSKVFPAIFFPACVWFVKGIKHKVVYSFAYIITSLVLSLPYILTTSYIGGLVHVMSEGGPEITFSIHI